MHTTTRRLQVGDKVRSRTGDRGTIVPLDEWPAHRPSSWTDENTVIIHWTSGLVTAGMTGFDFSPFPRDVAEKILTLVELAPTLCQATVMAFDGIDSGELGPCDAPATGTRTGYEGAAFPVCDEHAAPQGEPADIAEDDGVHREAERCAYCGGRGTYTAHERYPQGGGGTNKTVTCHCPAGRALKAEDHDAPALVQLDRDDAAARALNALLEWVATLDETEAPPDVYREACDRLAEAARDYRQVVTR